MNIYLNKIDFKIKRNYIYPIINYYKFIKIVNVIIRINFKLKINTFLVNSLE